MSRDDMERLQTATRAKLRKFDSLRGRQVPPGRFWDVVVVTALDRSQREAYELQIREKLDRKELPLGPHYRVFSDPPGYKIGNGGSTLYALKELKEIYGEALKGMKVILIHAGGYSQRLPTASALGKVFLSLPLGDPPYQMLELKLAMYVDFPPHMAPGVLVSCSDDIELYSAAGGGGRPSACTARGSPPWPTPPPWSWAPTTGCSCWRGPAQGWRLGALAWRWRRKDPPQAPAWRVPTQAWRWKALAQRWRGPA